MKKEENKNMTYPELMQEASKVGGPDNLIKASEYNGVLKGLVVGLVSASLAMYLISLIDN